MGLGGDGAKTTHIFFKAYVIKNILHRNIYSLNPLYMYIIIFSFILKCCLDYEIYHSRFNMAVGGIPYISYKLLGFPEISLLFTTLNLVLTNTICHDFIAILIVIYFVWQND